MSSLDQDTEQALGIQELTRCSKPDRQSGHTSTPVEPEGIDHRIPGGQFLFLSFFFLIEG